MQKELTATLGTVGATHVRFLYGLPFAGLFLLVILMATGSEVTIALGAAELLEQEGTPTRVVSMPSCSPPRLRFSRSRAS